MTDNRTPEQATAAMLGSNQELIDLAHNAWSMAICAMQGMCIPADWGNSVEQGLRKYGIDVDGELSSFEVNDDGYKQAVEYWQRMYEELLTERIGEERNYPEHDGRYECPECGNVVYYDELHGGGWTIYVEDYQIPFNNCPNCGKAVKR